MKKSIKYAGIAAATLLAVAPVTVAPVVSQAAFVDDVNTPASEFTSAKNKFINQFGDIDDDSTYDYSTLPIGYNYRVSASTFVNKNSFIMSKALNATDDKATLKLLDSKNVEYYLTAEDAKHNVYDGTANKKAYSLNKAIRASDSMLPVSFTLYAKDTDINGDGSDYKAVATFTLNKSDEGNELTSLNAKFTTPVNVAKNSKTAVSQLVSTANTSIVDQDGEAVSTAGTEVAPAFFKTYAAAMDAVKAYNNNDKTQLNPTKPADQLDGDIEDGEFKTAGTYYQVVTFKAGQDTELDDFITNYKDDPSSYTIYVNGKVASQGYDFVNGKSSTVASEANLQTISFVRTVNVSDSTSEWTTTENKGVVTTKATTPYYTLVNDNGDKITNRALAKNTAWITDQKRVDQNGTTQYRVATGEWIDANDVTFSDKATDNNEGEYTDVQALNGKVTLDGPSSFVYFLYNNEGKQIANRALTGDSAWFTDKKATNAAGVTVYHVATGEWVQAGSGVNYSAY